jgi:hypothetical protein
MADKPQQITDAVARDIRKELYRYWPHRYQGLHTRTVKKAAVPRDKRRGMLNNGTLKLPFSLGKGFRPERKLVPHIKSVATLVDWTLWRINQELKKAWLYLFKMMAKLRILLEKLMAQARLLKISLLSTREKKNKEAEPEPEDRDDNLKRKPVGASFHTYSRPLTPEELAVWSANKKKSNKTPGIQFETTLEEVIDTNIKALRTQTEDVVDRATAALVYIAIHVNEERYADLALDALVKLGETKAILPILLSALEKMPGYIPYGEPDYGRILRRWGEDLIREMLEWLARQKGK